MKKIFQYIRLLFGKKTIQEFQLPNKKVYGKTAKAIEEIQRLRSQK